MRLAGIQKLTLLDFPGKTAATVFTPGCNFRCPYCHNADLVAEGFVNGPAGCGGQEPGIAPEDVLAFLDKRRGLLDGVCITGGEPLLQPGLGDFCASVKMRGFAVKLDTNGSLPDRLRAVVEAGLVDYVAMDVKNAPERYAETVGAGASGAKNPCNASHAEDEDPRTGARAEEAGSPQRSFDRSAVRASIDYLLSGPVPFEFRTTVVRELHTAENLLDLARWIEGAPAWFLQNFVESENVLVGAGTFHPWDADALRDLLPALQAFVPSASLRGME